ncbi:DUF4129 domain-containing protein [Leptolyngbya sp. FACHB-16]|nr:DUF4129 domain-containing protein [Leptolyngbya sp. FACHB-16]MBD1914181.1 DUF4129 domain-containing protein [Leptolyngbya sp. FACHB-8]MBD2157188.1 DUF4129 domain-containing protein [Leptolyngbya sp. FACHB-16]
MLPISLATEFQRINPGWVIQRETRRVSEWLNLILFGGDRNPNDYIPNWAIPEWLLRTIFWTFTVTLATWAGWQLYRLLAPYINELRLARTDYVVVGATAPEVGTPVEEWLRRSHAAQQQGNYREACRTLYMAALQKLSDADLIRQQSSRTDGEYLSLLSELPQPQPYEELVRVHELLCFGDRPITAETYQRCQRAFQEISA